MEVVRSDDERTFLARHRGHFRLVAWSPGCELPLHGGARWCDKGTGGQLSLALDPFTSTTSQVWQCAYTTPPLIETQAAYNQEHISEGQWTNAIALISALFQTQMKHKILLNVAFWQNQHGSDIFWETRMNTSSIALGRWAEAHRTATGQLRGEWLVGRLTWGNAQ